MLKRVGSEACGVLVFFAITVLIVWNSERQDARDKLENEQRILEEERELTLIRNGKSFEALTLSSCVCFKCTGKEPKGQTL